MNVTVTARHGLPSSRAARLIALVVGTFYVVVGLSAFFTPQWFYSTVAPYPPYSQHLFHDVGAFQVGLGLVLILAVGARAALQPALLAVLAASLLHVVSHVEDAALGGHVTDPFALSLLAALLAVAIVAEWRAARASQMVGAPAHEVRT